MNSTRTVTLELLRHGPENSQLLSSSIQYLALCGNHPAITVNMPFEHHQLIARYRALRYQDSVETQFLQFTDTAQVMGNLLGAMPGLIAELTECPCQDEDLTHLRLILSVAELAMLPFELANAPNGFPGAGQALALQSQVPLCITREVRRVSKTRFQWPSKPRILFIAAAPQKVGNIPLEQHLLTLRRVVEPWVSEAIEPGGAPGNVPASPKVPEDLGRHLVVLPQASPGEIRKTLAEADGTFTHVHILAHGVPHSVAGEKRYGLALHDDVDPKECDIVDGARLAALLRTYRKGGVNELCSPAVVTIASCDSGNVGSVVVPGASIAHALHEGGIPLVVASQFPLSFAGSILLAEVLYQGLLWGVDPRTLLNDLRRQLKARIPHAHDWASLVAYAALPEDLHLQLPRLRLDQARRSINASLRFMDQVTESYFPKLERGTGPGTPTWQGPKPLPRQETMDRARAKVKAGVERLQGLLRDTPADKPADRATIYGFLASMEKRDAKIVYGAGKMGTGPGHGHPQDYVRKAREALERARDYYRRAFTENPASSWALVQELSLTFVLEGRMAVRPEDWTTARVLSEKDLYRGERNLVAWAHGNLIELFLLAVERPEFCLGESPRDKALEHARELFQHGRDSFEVYSTRRQIERYADWFYSFGDSEYGLLASVAQEVVDLLPHNPSWA